MSWKEIAKCSLEDSDQICADFESSGEHRDEEGWAGEGGTVDIKVLAAKSSNLSWIPRTHLGKKERTNSHKLSSDLHTTTMVCTHTHTHTHTHTYTCILTQICLFVS